MNSSTPFSASSSSSQHVRVAVHVRPLLPGEAGDLDSVSIEGGRKVLFGAAAGAGGGGSASSGDQQQQSRSAVAFDLAAGLSAGGVDPALLYDTCVSPLVEGLFEGYNASVLAYGPTGSGKTFTMGTDFSGGGSGGSGSGGGFPGGDGNDAPSSSSAAAASASAMMPGGGIVPRVAQDLFSRVERVLKEERGRREEAGGGAESEPFVVEACSVRVGFVEVYAEEVRDLLSGSASAPSASSASDIPGAAAPFSPSTAPTITLRDSESSSRNANNGSPLASSGATEIEVSTAEELSRLLSLAGRRRATGATAVNAASSRSHAIVTLTVEQRGRRRRRGVKKGRSGEDAGAVGPETTVSAKMCLVDLAGSERQKRTLATGARLKEATAINRGLLALGNVIGALAAQSKASAAATTTTSSLQQQQQQHRHIPYRDSKLTRLLADALGGASRTLLIACVSRADADADEAAATLRYAARARAIVNVPRANVSSSSNSPGCGCAGSLCAANAAELEALRMELAAARGRIAALERELDEARKASCVDSSSAPVSAAPPARYSVQPSSETAARYAAEAAAARRRAAALRAAAAAEGAGGGGTTAAATLDAAAAVSSPAAANIISPVARPPLPPPPPAAPGPLAAAALRAGGGGGKQATAAATTTKPQPLSLPSSSSFARRVTLSSVDGNSPERKQQQPQSSSRWW